MIGKVKVILTDELMALIRAHVPDADQMPLLAAVDLARQRDMEAAAQLERDALDWEAAVAVCKED